MRLPACGLYFVQKISQMLFLSLSFVWNCFDVKLCCGFTVTVQSWWWYCATIRSFHLHRIHTSCRDSCCKRSAFYQTWMRSILFHFWVILISFIFFERPYECSLLNFFTVTFHFFISCLNVNSNFFNLGFWWYLWYWS